MLNVLQELVPGPGFVAGSQALPFPDDETTALYDKLVADLEIYLQAMLTAGTSPRVLALHGLRETALLARRLRDHASAVALLQKVGNALGQSCKLRFIYVELPCYADFEFAYVSLKNSAQTDHIIISVRRFVMLGSIDSTGWLVDPTLYIAGCGGITGGDESA